MVEKAPDVMVIQGDISEEVADAIVSPDDPGLSMSGGASAALRDVGGEALYEAAQERVPVEVGAATVTSAFDLFAEYVIHAVSKPNHRDATQSSVRSATVAALHAADERGCRSVVIPPLGTGVGGANKVQSAKLICEATSTEQFDSLREIRVITRSSESYRTLFETVAGFRGSMDGFSGTLIE